MSETVRLLPPGLDLGATDDPVEAKAWKNMIFDRDGVRIFAIPSMLRIMPLRLMLMVVWRD